MRKWLRITAAVLLLVALVAWAVLGAHTGWTKNTVTRMELDPITEIEFPVIEERFVPGVDFLAAALLAAGILFGVSFAFRTKNNESQSEP